MTIAEQTTKEQYTLEQWLYHIEHCHGRAIEMGLERCKRVLSRLDLLKPKSKIITIAGTNGKGSTVKFLDEILRTIGYSVGTYTSPYLYRYNERITIHGQYVTDDALCHAFAVIEDGRGEDKLTYFEFSTVAALYCLQQQPLDVMILEVGMGGRLDAVNCLDADIAVITNIDFDHMQYLGNTREAIGFEKAGIFRQGGYAVCGDRDLPQSVVRHAEQLNVTILQLGKHFDYSLGNYLDKKQQWRWHCRWQSVTKNFHNLPTPKIHGNNAATAIMIATLLGATFTADQLAQVCEHCVIPGRIQYLALANNEAQIILDVAHNSQSIANLSRHLADNPIVGHTYAVVAMNGDKAIAESLSCIQSQIDSWFIAPLPAPRGARAEEIIQVLPENSIKIKFDNVAEAMVACLKESGVNDRIVVFGSFRTLDAVNDVIKGTTVS